LGFTGLPICQTATQAVLAEGAEDADLLIIGEAPGADEDRRGTPFCGESGQLLDKILAAIDCSRQSNSFITNSVYWRPPGNRTPTEEEIAICQPFVQKTIQLIQPKVILLMGGVAVRSVLESPLSIGKLRGKWHPTEAVKGDALVRVAHNPAYLLRQPRQKRLAWDDALAVKQRLQN